LTGQLSAAQIPAGVSGFKKAGLTILLGASGKACLDFTFVFAGIVDTRVAPVDGRLVHGWLDVELGDGILGSRS
jgi:hypothetical protein